MSILNDLKYKRLELFDLLAMGYNLYLNNFRLFASTFCLILLPWNIVIRYLYLNTIQDIYLNPDPFDLYIILLTLFISLLLGSVYQLAISIITEKLVLTEKPRLKFVLKQNSHLIMPLIYLDIRFKLNIFIRLFLSLVLFISCIIFLFPHIFNIILSMPNIISMAGIFFQILFIPAIIYGINNIFYFQAFIFGNQQGKSAFQYSRYLVKGNWRKIFILKLLSVFTYFYMDIIITKILSSMISNNSVLIDIIVASIAGLIGIPFSVGMILLFLNLDFQKR